uniref:EH domain-containing protein 1 n=1 Tax=Periophthalmus magnuspinnatus TaxID=409849 RepID=A0A3B4AYZ5_9GOBI
GVLAVGHQQNKRERERGCLFQNVSEGLRRLYRTKLFPLEDTYRFHDFHSPALEDADFDNKPMVLLVGQYSTGKTTFIRHLMEQDFPGMRIGPEPTTDSFIAVMHGEQDGVIPGNALVVDPKKPFRHFCKMGNFGESCKNIFLQSIRVDRIILLFDAHKLDISDEFSEVIRALKNHEDKMRVVLNKADQISTQQLMRVYGALMWSLGKIINTPEVVRVYIGSFWAQPLLVPDNRKLFEAEEQDLFLDIQSLPRNAALRKLNDLIKRARLAKVHAYIISSLKKEMPSVFGKDSKKKELINNLGEIYQRIEKEHQISPGDFPNISKMQEILNGQDFSKFASLKPKLLEQVEDMLAHDIARLMALVRQEEAAMPSQSVHGGAFEGAMSGPFGHGYGEGASEGIDELEWVVGRDKPSYDEIFYTLGPINGKVSGAAAKKEMLKSKLPNTVLGKIWKLADVDRDGYLDDEEFALANHLIKVKLEGHELPAELPNHLVPPSKRDLVVEESRKKMQDGSSE